MTNVKPAEIDSELPASELEAVHGGFAWSSITKPAPSYGPVVYQAGKELYDWMRGGSNLPPAPPPAPSPRPAPVPHPQTIGSGT